MARKPKLDKGVTLYVDRHGRARARFRLQGKDFPLPHPATKEYAAAYKMALSGVRPHKPRVKPESIGDLFERFYASARFNRATDKWKGIVRSTLADFQERARDAYVAEFQPGHIERMLIDRAVKADGKGGPAASQRLHEQLIRLFEFAVRLGWISKNPAKDADAAVNYKAKGYHIWTVADILRFRERHELGTKARLAMELALWTGLRRSDIAALTPDNIKDGRIVATASKTGKGVNVIIAPDLQGALDAMGEFGAALLTTEYGKPFSAAGLGNWFRDRCNEAKLPKCTIHGLRKAITSLSANEGATQQELKALGQWSNDSEVSIYAAGANQKRLADAAIMRVVKGRTLSNLPKKVSQKRRIPLKKNLDMAGAEGLEPTTLGFGDRCSTN